MSRGAGKGGAASPRRWLVAAWPGMGNVAVIAAGYLIQKLGLRPVAELGTPGLFDVRDVEVAGGIITPARQPRSLVFRMPEPRNGLDLTVFLGEAQPDHGAYALSQGLLEHAEEYKVERVVTFASMSTQLHPTEQPRVFGAATTKELLAELERAELGVMRDGQIGGLNGVVLGAAAQRGLPGMCLLGEIPYFAAAVGNPKAAKAVLDAFCALSGLELDFEELLRHVEASDEMLLKMMSEVDEDGEADEDEEEEDELPSEATPQPPPGEAGAAGEGVGEKPAEAPELEGAAKSRIERMFEDAKRDRSKAQGLKRELDRLGVFGRYEDRFLDLFKRAE